MTLECINHLTHGHATHLINTYKNLLELQSQSHHVILAVRSNPFQSWNVCLALLNKLCLNVLHLVTEFCPLGTQEATPPKSHNCRSHGSVGPTAWWIMAHLLNELDRCSPYLPE